MQCLPWMIARISELSGNHPVAEVFLIGWAFSYLIEGASGFGTPVALAAPMLVSLGHDPISTIAACLAMNTLATPCALISCPPTPALLLPTCAEPLLAAASFCTCHCARRVLVGMCLPLSIPMYAKLTHRCA